MLQFIEAKKETFSYTHIHVLFNFPLTKYYSRKETMGPWLERVFIPAHKEQN